VGKDVDLAAVSCPEVPLRSPGIHTYSHTRRYQEMVRVIPTLSASWRSRLQVTGLDPKPPAANVRFAEV
jgi:hypothetical protein